MTYMYDILDMLDRDRFSKSFHVLCLYNNDGHFYMKCIIIGLC